MTGRVATVCCSGQYLACAPSLFAVPSVLLMMSVLVLPTCLLTAASSHWFSLHEGLV